MFSHESDAIDTQGHPFVGVQWPIVGSRGDSYSVEMTDYGFSCDCPARVKCKHIKGVEKRLDDVDL